MHSEARATGAPPYSPRRYHPQHELYIIYITHALNGTKAQGEIYSDQSVKP